MHCMPSAQTWQEESKRISVQICEELCKKGTKSVCHTMEKDTSNEQVYSGRTGAPSKSVGGALCRFISIKLVTRRKRSRD